MRVPTVYLKMKDKTRPDFLPIFPALFFLLELTYFWGNYASRLGTGLLLIVLNDVTMLRACLTKECSAPPFQATMAVQVIWEWANITYHKTRQWGWDVITSYMCLVLLWIGTQLHDNIWLHGFCLSHLWVFCMKAWSIHSKNIAYCMSWKQLDC